MKIYIAGKITGDPDYKQNFSDAAEAVKKTFTDAVIINPAEHPEGLSAAEYMRLCFAEIDMADFVVVLPNWFNSRGARLEKEYCEYIGKTHVFLVIQNGRFRYLSVPYMGEVKA